MKLPNPPSPATTILMPLSLRGGSHGVVVGPSKAVTMWAEPINYARFDLLAVEVLWRGGEYRPTGTPTSVDTAVRDLVGVAAAGSLPGAERRPWGSWFRPPGTPQRWRSEPLGRVAYGGPRNPVTNLYTYALTLDLPPVPAGLVVEVRAVMRPHPS